MVAHHFTFSHCILLNTMVENANAKQRVSTQPDESHYCVRCHFILTIIETTLTQPTIYHKKLSLEVH